MGERGKPRSGRGRLGRGKQELPEESSGARDAAAEAARDQHEDEAAERPTLRGPGEGRADRRRAAKRIKRRRRLRATREIPILIGVALLIALVLKTFLVQAFVIPSGSMEQTIKIDDRVLVDKLTPWFGWEPQRGEVVVFRDPGGWLEQDAQATAGDPPAGIKQLRDALTWIGLLPSAEDQDLIKRVIGVGGDTVVCCEEAGRITVNGVAVDEPYLYPGNPPSRIEFEVTVPEGHIFVMGDHRSNSADSRYHLEGPDQGTVPIDLVVGRAVVIAWPFAHWQRLDGSDAFAAVPDPDGAGDGAPARAGPPQRAAIEDNVLAPLPIPAELPLVMGVVGLWRSAHGRKRSVRSGCGGCGGRCTVRCGRTGGTSGESPRRSIWRGAPRRRQRPRRPGRGRLSAR
ncbi:signal peptidase I [Streptomyces carpaticus]|uniref:Signal peptidase I n=1 Tax=Streptomyces carpaticus TaxID=285558 RepID=A0ABV4ZII8_9ACTN